MRAVVDHCSLEVKLFKITYLSIDSRQPKSRHRNGVTVLDVVLSIADGVQALTVRLGKQTHYLSNQLLYEGCIYKCFTRYAACIRNRTANVRLHVAV